MHIWRLGLVALCLTTCCPAIAQTKPQVVSHGDKFDVSDVLADESTTVVLFMQQTSVMERQFLDDLQKQMVLGPKLALDIVSLSDVSAPAAQQYKVTATPTAVVYDRFGNELARTSDPAQITAAVRKGRLMGRIKWIDEDNPDAAKIYGAPPEALKRGIAGILKTMSLRPEVVEMMNIISKVHFSDGFLKRREHEMIAAYVSGLNKCKF